MQNDHATPGWPGKQLRPGGRFWAVGERCVVRLSTLSGPCEPESGQRNCATSLRATVRAKMLNDVCDYTLHTTFILGVPTPTSG